MWAVGNDEESFNYVRVIVDVIEALVQAVGAFRPVVP